MEFLDTNTNYSNTTYYAVDSSVYFSFQRVDKLDLLFSFCKGNAVITPKIEGEIFGQSIFSYSYVGLFEPWLRTPKKNDSTLVWDNSYFNNITSTISTDKYRSSFYLANVDYHSITSTINTSSWQYDFSKLKSEADREIARWTVLNSGSVLLTNDQPIRTFFKNSKINVVGAIGILIELVKKGLLTLQIAESIYNKWSEIDPGCCKWKKINKVRHLVEFNEIYLSFNFQK